MTALGAAEAYPLWAPHYSTETAVSWIEDELVAAGRRGVGSALRAGLEAVAHHLSICAECCEEYEALLEALKAMDG